MEIKHKKEDTERAFEAYDDGKKIGEITYTEKSEKIITINHTEVDKSFRDEGIAGRLLNAITEYIRKNDYKVNLNCPYVEKQYTSKEKFNDISIVT